jgi:hypothetical protein
MQVEFVCTLLDPAPCTMSWLASSKGPLSELPSPWRGMVIDMGCKSLLLGDCLILVGL